MPGEGTETRSAACRTRGPDAVPTREAGGRGALAARLAPVAVGGDRSAYLDTRREQLERPAAPGGHRFGCRQVLGDLLFAAWPGTAEALADALIEEFGSLPALLAADPARVVRCLGNGSEGIAAFLATVRSAQMLSLRREIEEGPLLATSAALLDYLHVGMAWTADEEFRVLYLNSRNRLLRDETVAAGTPNEVTIHPRAIVKRALELGATAIVLVHNHPSGDPKSSRDDIRLTEEIVRAGKPLGIALHDHVVIGSRGHASFAGMGLL